MLKLNLKIKRMEEATAENKNVVFKTFSFLFFRI